MNLEELRQALLQIIEEGRNLSLLETELVPHTEVRVKKGKTQDFLNLAKEYYQKQIREEDAVDYVLKNLEEPEKTNLPDKEYGEEKKDFRKLEELNKSLELNAKDREKYRKAKDDLSKRAEQDPSIWSEIRNLQDLMKSLEEEKREIQNNITQVKDNINNRVKVLVEERMKTLRDRYLTSKPKDHETGYDESFILKEDKDEYDDLYLLLKVIENASGELPLINIDNLICVNPHQENTARILTSRLSVLKSLNPEIKPLKKPQLLELNEELTKEIAMELAKLIKRAKDHPEEPLAEGKEVLASDLDEYNLLAKQFEILTMIYDNDTLTTVGKAEIPIEKEEEYKSVCEKLEALRKEREETNAHTEEREPAKNKREPKNNLKRNDSKENIKTSVKRKAVKIIRKAKNQEWWQKNGKKVVGVGLSLAVATYSLTTLAPTVIYATSCLSLAEPALAGAINSFNASLINGLGISLGSLNLNVAAANVGTATLTALAKVGVIGGGVAAANKIIKTEETQKLSDPERKTLTQKLMTLSDQIIDKSKSLTSSLANKASIFTENLAYATDGPNINLANERINTQIEMDSNIETLDDDAIFKEIQEGVKKQIEGQESKLEEERKAEEEAQKRKAIEDRINERFNRIKHDEEAIYIKPTDIAPPKREEPVTTPVIKLPSDEEIMQSISTENLYLARIDSYLEAIKEKDTMTARNLQSIILGETGINVGEYDINEEAEISRMKEDILNATNNKEEKRTR